MAEHDGTASGVGTTSAVVTGGCVLLALYGLLVLVVDSVFNTELVPNTLPGAALVIAALILVGAFVGAGISKVSNR